MKPGLLAGGFCLALCLLKPGYCLAQETALFKESEPLAIRLSLSFKEIKKKTNDSTYLPAVLFYQVGDRWDSVAVSLRSRGNFRRKNCFFTPLRIRIKKGDGKGTLFEGNKDLKLVLPCETSSDNNTLLMKEYLCYRMYEDITPYYFSTRLVKIDLTEGASKTRKYQIMGILIEDDDLVAKRHHGTVSEQSLHPLLLHDTTALQYYFFQYMIANTDWSTTYSHNSKTIKIGPRKFIPMAYDFDMSGFVDAPYAVVDPSLDLPSVRVRLYRGFCYPDDSVIQYVRNQYIAAGPRLKQEISRHEKYFEPRQVQSMNRYMDDFFATLTDDSKFRDNIIKPCRTK